MRKKDGADLGDGGKKSSIVNDHGGGKKKMGHS